MSDANWWLVWLAVTEGVWLFAVGWFAGWDRGFRAGMKISEVYRKALFGSKG